MARIRKQAGWKQSGNVADFLPQEEETKEQPEEYWDGTLEHIKALSRIAASRAYITGGHSVDKVDAAFSAISMLISEDAETPVKTLIEQGVSAISRELQTTLKHHGVRNNGSTGAKFNAYWGLSRVTFPSYGLDHLALSQVWEELEEKHRQTLLGRATHKDTTAYAESLGMTRAAVAARIRKARKAALELWFDWETAPPIPIEYPRPTHCKHGHSYEVHGGWVNRRSDGRGRSRYCKACDRIQQKKQREEK